MKKGVIIGGFIAVLLLSGVGYVPHASASCGTESCPLDIFSHNKMEEVELESGSLTELQIVCGSIKQDQPWAGRDRVKFGEIRRPDHDEQETQSHNIRLVLYHRLSLSWSLSAGLPFLKRSHAHIENSGHSHEGEDDHGHEGDEEVQRWDFLHLGDVNIWARLRPWRDAGKSNLALGLGLSLPTGSIQVRNNQGRLAEPTLQPGTGALAWLFEFSLRRFKKPNHLLGRQFAHFSVSSFFRLNTSGQSAYRFGNQWDLHLGGAYPIKAGVQLLGQFVSRWRDRDDAGRSGELTDATGGN